MDAEAIEPVHRMREHETQAWTFHRSTARWLFNVAGGHSPQPRPGREHPGSGWTPLPEPAALSASLTEAIGDRVSCRAFGPGPVPLAQLAAVLQHTYGLEGRSEDGELELVDRPVPSAGGLYPLEVTLLVRAVEGLDPGVHHYVPAAGGLEKLRDGPLPPTFLTYLFMGQPWVAEAGVVLVVSVVTGRSMVKYGDRGYRYLLLEAGHLVQNVNLVATALGLGSVNIGGFYDDELAALIRVDPEVEIPLYASALGRPLHPGDRMASRALDRSS